MGGASGERSKFGDGCCLYGLIFCVCVVFISNELIHLNSQIKKLLIRIIRASSL